jgi:hypothetical protein
LWTPTINYGYLGLPIIILLINGFLYLKTHLKKEEREKKSKMFPIIFWSTLSYIIILPALTSLPIFKAEEYRDLIGEIKIGEDFANKVSPISTDEIRVVDRSIAYKLGDKVLGSKPSLGSQVKLGDFNIQMVNDKLYWISPLIHSGFFKWSKNKKGTNGYVMVSATDERDVKLVQEINGKPIFIKFQPGAYFSDNLKRHVYLNGYITKGFTDFTLEIDNNGIPYWVISLFNKRIGFSGEDVTGILVVNAETGELREFSIENAPDWVDRIQPADFIVEQLNDWGEYVQGYWNFANENKLTTTKGISLVYGENNRSYWYTGLTSVGSDEGTVGFVLVDTRTKESVWYKQIGATEEAAQLSAMGKVQEKRFAASFPITYNINGIPTYVMSLKDQAGLDKMLAMVSVEDYTIVGVGNNMKETLRAYKNALNSNGNSISPSSTRIVSEIKTIVLRISSDIRNGNTNYYLITKDYINKIFIGSSLISNELPITNIGDSVLIRYDDGGNELIDITKFDNLEFQLKNSKH